MQLPLLVKSKNSQQTRYGCFREGKRTAALFSFSSVYRRFYWDSAKTRNRARKTDDGNQRNVKEMYGSESQSTTFVAEQTIPTQRQLYVSIFMSGDISLAPSAAP